METSLLTSGTLMEMAGSFDQETITTDAIISLKVTAGLSVTQDIYLDAEPRGE
ncbi:hypothetical protein [Desulfothermus naphthae]